eukprot:TRINITY_DN23290_c0_g1_i9.p1 TRINITY_DN23290_c0_g1~~TRINITY_DN23290_c0_g1_i9.p1  ORF type:complete len:908 (-),score=217.58 TRINITY_DN23290_c0_g1_i9:48-2771(-)
MLRSLVGSEMCIRDRYQRRVRGVRDSKMSIDELFAELKEEDARSRRAKNQRSRADPTSSINRTVVQHQQEPQPAQTTEVTPEGLAHFVRREMRSVVSGSLSERRNSLKQISAIFSEDAELARLAGERCWDELKTLVPALSDSNSTCREHAARALSLVIPSALNSGGIVDSAQLFTTVVGEIEGRFAGDKSPSEDIEEVRIQLMATVQTMLEAMPAQLPEESVGPLVGTATAACLDACPEVKKAGCTCSATAICAGADVQNQDWEKLLQAIAYHTDSPAGHQHFKVRETALRTVGKLMPLAPADSWDEMIKFIKKIHFDRHPKMRHSLLDVVLGWLLQGAAAQYVPSMLIQLMMGEADDVEDVSEYAEGVMARAALAVFPDATDPLEAVERFVVGELPKLLDEVFLDMTEWRAVTRKKGTQTLGVLARYAGENLGSNAKQTLNALYKICRDDDDTVAAVGFTTAEIVGEVVPASCWVPVAVDDLTNGSFQESFRISHLQVVSSLLATSSPEDLSPLLPQLLVALRSSVLTFEASALVHHQVLDCISSMLENLEAEVVTDAENFFETAMTLRAAAVENPALCQEIDATCLELAELLQLPSVAALYGACAAPCIGRLLDWVDLKEPCPWEVDSPALSKLEAMLLLADPTSLVPFLGTILKAVATVVELGSGKDQEVQLRVVMMLTALSSEGPICQALKPMYATALFDVVKPAAKWFSGRMVERKREAAIEFLRRTLTADCMSQIVEDEYAAEVVIQAVEHGIDDDWNPELRRCSTICLGELIASLGRGKTLTSALLLQVWPSISKRLDDKLDEVRISALVGLAYYFDFMLDDIPQDHIETTISVLMVHLDDPSPDIRQYVAQVLQRATEVSPRCIITAVSYTHLRAHETPEHLVCRLLLEKKKKNSNKQS